MISMVFDPDAKAEFLAAVQYYESCQSGLGRRFIKLAGFKMATLGWF